MKRSGPLNDHMEGHKTCIRLQQELESNFIVLSLRDVRVYVFQHLALFNTYKRSEEAYREQRRFKNQGDDSFELPPHKLKTIGR